MLVDVSTDVRQSWLIDWQNPLKGNKWKQFFATIPNACGVYQFKSGDGKVLYVGQSKHLKDRLKSYRYVHPDRSSRKLCRLVHEVECIEFEVCKNSKTTRVEEAKKIHEYRPKHNRVYTHPESNRFIQLKFIQQDRWRWRILNTPKEEPNALVFGAFSGNAARSLVACIRRIECFRMRRSLTVESVPLGFFDKMVPDQGEWIFSLEPNLTNRECDRLARKVVEFLQGKEDGWLHRVYGKSGQLCEQSCDRWLRERWYNDFEQLQSFYRFQAQRNRSYASNYAIRSADPIGVHQLDLLKARNTA